MAYVFLEAGANVIWRITRLSRQMIIICEFMHWRREMIDTQGQKPEVNHYFLPLTHVISVSMILSRSEAYIDVFVLAPGFQF